MSSRPALRLLARVAFIVVAMLTEPARAVCYDLPLGNPDLADPWGCTGYCNGGNRTNPHRGLDFPAPWGTPIAAVADGWVNEKIWDGCLGHALSIAHADGWYSGYVHMQSASFRQVGEFVRKGDVIGYVGGTGSCAFGPHLHLTISNQPDGYRAGWIYSVTADPYSFILDRVCRCECNPGQVERQGCGRCGTTTRTCGGDCRWGGWGACAGQGPCSPGQVGERACCDCGHQRRTCTSSCQWPTGWSACAGPDPAGRPACDTGEYGACAEGRTRCVSGCLACVRVREPSDELCDDVDNDCDGTVDEGSPRRLGPTPPAFGAELIDASFPRWEAPGQRATAWLSFRNRGRETWRAREVWLRPDAVAEGRESRLRPGGEWPGFDVATLLDHDVAPGATAVFQFPISAAEEADVTETFSLVGPSGRAMACPAPTAQLAVATVGFASPEAPSPAPSSESTPAPASGCHALPTSTVALFGLLRLIRRRDPRA